MKNTRIIIDPSIAIDVLDYMMNQSKENHVIDCITMDEPKKFHREELCENPRIAALLISSLKREIRKSEHLYTTV